MTPNQKAFLGTVAYSELGKALLAMTDNGYNVIVGSTPKNLILFDSYADHPRRRIWIERLKDYSTAAGRYQLLMRYFDAYRKLLGLKDFSPASQDAIALQQIRERGALPDIDAGRFAAAIWKCRNIWASLPGAGYAGQRENKLEDLQVAFIAAGGKVQA